MVKISEDKQRNAPAGRTTWRQRFALVGIGLALLLAAEGAVRVLGLAPAFRPRDPLMAGQAGEAAYERRTSADGEAMWVCPWVSPDYPLNYPPVPVAKAANELRIMVFGGSSAVGYPYDARWAFSGFLEAGLAALYPDRHIRVINCAQNAVAAGRCAQLMGRMLALKPDAYVVYSGNNEYENNHIYRLIRRRGDRLAPLRSVARHSALYRGIESLTLRTRAQIHTRYVVSEQGVKPPEYSPMERQLVRDNYAFVVQQMIDLCRDKAVPLVLCTVAANRVDWPPYRSTFRETTAPKQREQWLRGFAAALDALRRGAPADALAACDALAKIDDHRADLHYLRGHTLAMLNRLPEARVAFDRACDLDNVCYRARPSHNDVLRRLAAEQGVALSDNVAALQRANEHKLLGNNYFWDHCHPRPNAHKVMALQIARTLIGSGILPERPVGWEARFGQAAAAAEAAVTYTDAMHARAWRNTASGWLGLWTSHRAEDNLLRGTDAYIRRALECLDKAVKYDETLAGAWFYRGVCLAQLGRIDEARADWTRARDLEPEGARLRSVLQGLLSGEIPHDRGFEAWLFVRNEMKADAPSANRSF